MKQKNESILDMLIVFFPLLPGFLWLLFGTAVVEVILVVDGGVSGGERGRDVEMMVEMMELVAVERRCQR